MGSSNKPWLSSITWTHHPCQIQKPLGCCPPLFLSGFQSATKLAAATGQRCLPLSLDVRAIPAITAAVDQALKEFGKIDILVNCEWLTGEARGLLMGRQYRTSLFSGFRTPVPGPRLLLGQYSHGPGGHPGNSAYSRSQGILMSQNSPFQKKKKKKKEACLGGSLS